MKRKFKKLDRVLIFNCQECVGGSVGYVVDFDRSEPDKPAYLVTDLFAPDRDFSRWVRPENMKLLEFEKSRSVWRKLIDFFKRRK